ncbi:MAG: SusC/RagA family TonB-linked outer membrane protein, partial [bacterium]|nr:SusC/RagA family TonB-linked outer membrane protein [bacterium]
GRLNYSFADKYLLTAKMRYDGSSKFPKENRFGLLPSLSVGWRMGQESFMDWSRTWLDDLKIRASYGSIGNQNINPYGYIAAMGINQNTTWLSNGDKITSFSVPGLVRANYTWETVSTLDFGFDLNLLNNRFQATFDWYKRMTKDMLSSGVELPATVGTSAPLQNVADMHTKGWELSVNWRDQIGDWRYHIGINLYDYLSTITNYNNKSGNLNYKYNGYQFGEIWGYVSDGFYSIDDFDPEKAKVGTWVLKEGVTSINGYNPQPGDEKFKDLDGNGIINTGEGTVEEPGDRKIIGNSTPRYQFGAQAGVGYKGFDLSVMLQGVGKRDVWLGGAALFPFGAGGSDGVFHPIFYNQTDYWRAKSYDPESPDYMVAANPDAQLFRIYGQEGNVGSNTRTSTKYLQDGSYLRIKNVTLAYTLPAQWLHPIHIQQLRLYVSVENLATFTSLPKGYDPENLKWSYPFYRTWSIGANLSF